MRGAEQFNSSVRTQAALSHRTVTRAAALSRSAAVRGGEDSESGFTVTLSGLEPSRVAYSQEVRDFRLYNVNL